MPLDPETVTRLCGQISREIRDYQKNLTLHFIVCRTGERKKAFDCTIRDFINHSESERIFHLLKGHEDLEGSAFLGTDIAKQNIFMGLGAHHSVLSVCVLNTDDFKSLNEARQQAYHFSYRSLEKATEYDDTTSGYLRLQTERRSSKDKNVARAAVNLRADIFSCIASCFHGDNEAAIRLAKTRALDVLTAQQKKYPDYYPFPIALDAVLFTLRQMGIKQVSKKKIIPAALKITADIAQTFDSAALKTWLDFAEPAQEMAWRGIKDADILSAAINMIPNTSVRAAAYQTIEITGIKPGLVTWAQKCYSLYANKAFNKGLHEKAVTGAFEKTIDAALRSGHPLGFFDLANEQNEQLSQGHIGGWCASALQTGGSVFDAAQQKDPPQAFAYLRKEMEAHREDVEWDALQELSAKIIAARREGRNMTLKDIPDFLRGLKGSGSLLKSIEKTLEETAYKDGSVQIKTGTGNKAS